MLAQDGLTEMAFHMNFRLSGDARLRSSRCSRPGSRREPPDLAAIAQTVGHARHSRPEDGLAGAVGRRRQGPSLEEHHRAPDRGPGRLGARRRAEQHKNPTRRGVMVWVETDGTVYWAVAENLVPTHTDGADRNDNKYIDNRPTYHQVNGDTSIGVEFAGNYPDVTRPATEAQIAAWRILVKVLRARYGIPLDHVYAHNWIDYKDARYCEGCALATLARQWGE